MLDGWNIMTCLLFTQRLVTCSDWDHRGDVAPIVFLDDEKSLTLAFVNVSADLFVGLVTSPRWAYAREASESVAALTACAVLQIEKQLKVQLIMWSYQSIVSLYSYRTYRLVHITFINIPTNSISIGMESRVTDAFVSGL